MKSFPNLTRRRLLAQTAWLASGLAATELVGRADAAGLAKVRVANLAHNSTVLALYHGLDKGYFKDEGLDVEVITVPTGPATVSALVSGAADVSWAAATVGLFAHARGIPVKLFLTTNQEYPPDHWTVWVVATGRSGVKSVKDLKGKTVMINANGTAGELAFRDRLVSVGLHWDDVKHVVVPFPQMLAALELGRADAAATFDAVQHPIMASKQIAARIIGYGTLAKTSAPTTSSAYFALGDWLAKNRDAAIRFGRAYDRGNKEILADAKLRIDLIVKAIGVDPQLAALSTTPEYKTPAVEPGAVAPVLDALVRCRMLEKPYPIGDVVETLPF